jgi:hypothetical protein
MALIKELLGTQNSTKSRAISTVRLRRKGMFLTSASTLQFFFSPHCLSGQRVAGAISAHFSSQLGLHGLDGRGKNVFLTKQHPHRHWDPASTGQLRLRKRSKVDQLSQSDAEMQIFLESHFICILSQYIQQIM